MKSRSMRVVLPGLAVAGMMGASVFLATPAPAEKDAFSDSQKSGIEAIVRDYLLKNPEIIRDAFIELQKRQAQAEASEQRKKIAEFADDLFRGTDALIAGNPKGDVTVVEFFDYNCPYCKQAFKQLMQLAEKDKNVRIVFKEFPVLGDPSQFAARAAIAAHLQGKYFEFHQALLEAPGRTNAAKVEAIAKKTGLDVDRMKKDMNSKAVTDRIAKIYGLARNLGIQGTPAYIVGNEVIAGAPPDLLEQLADAVEAVRKNGCEGCQG